MEAYEPEGAMDQAVEQGEDHGEGASSSRLYWSRRSPWVSGPFRWDWATKTDTDAACLADALGEFVTYFNDRYAWTREQTIPPCWAAHGALIEEITTLMWSRWAAFGGPLASPEAAQTWHTYRLPLFVARITTWIGVEASADCRSGHHQPSRLVDPERPLVTGRRPAPSRPAP